MLEVTNSAFESLNFSALRSHCPELALTLLFCCSVLHFKLSTLGHFKVSPPELECAVRHLIKNCSLCRSNSFSHYLWSKLYFFTLPHLNFQLYAIAFSRLLSTEHSINTFLLLCRTGEKTLLITKARSAEQSIIWRYESMLNAECCTCCV